ncbi:MAG: hypothetical protein QXV20_06550 [Candidatus Hadarchaeales archaeon]
MITLLVFLCYNLPVEVKCQMSENWIRFDNVYVRKGDIVKLEGSVSETVGSKERYVVSVSYTLKTGETSTYFLPHRFKERDDAERFVMNLIHFVIGDNSLVSDIEVLSNLLYQSMFEGEGKVSVPSTDVREEMEKGGQG